MADETYVWTRDDKADHGAGHPSGYDCDGYAMTEREACGNRFTPADETVRLTEQERGDVRFAAAHWRPEYDEGSRLYEVVEAILTAHLSAVEAERDRLRETVARVEALAEVWDLAAAADMDVESKTLRSVATYLRAALGDPR